MSRRSGTPDFRDGLYERYVSSFKGVDSRLSARALESYWSWCEHRFVPLLAGLARDAPLLELGCGPGHMLELLARKGFADVQGIDISAEQVAIARDKGLKAEVADVFECLQAARARYAAILALDFLEHFSREEVARLAPLIHAALAPGGLLVLQTPNGSGLFPQQVIYGDLTHLTIFSPSSLQQLLAAAGFGEFRFQETGPAPKNLVGCARVFLWNLVKVAANAVRRIETGKSQELWTENMICSCRKPAS